MPSPGDAAIARTISKVHDLPALPQITVTLLRLLNNPKSSAKDITAVMSKDPALAARLLRIVNSSYYGLKQKVASLTQAISLLGFRTVRSVLTVAAAQGVFNRRCKSPSFNQSGFVKHCVASAAVARHLATQTTHIDKEFAFVVGLLHDIGKLVIDQAYPMHYTTLYTHARDLHTSLAQAEQMVDGPTHAGAGAALAEKWDLPIELVDAIEYHHAMAQAMNPEVVAVLMITDYICSVKSVGAPDNFGQIHLEQAAWEKLQLGSNILPEILATVDVQIVQVRELFEI
jgi:putative nucleotidyltransferase with HDIG domain